MSESKAFLKYGQLGLRVVVVVLILLSLASAVGLLLTEGLSLTVVGEILITLYIAGLVFIGIFRNGIDTPNFRLALYFGLILWGVQRYISGADSIFTYVLFLAGIGLIVAEVVLRRR